MADAATVAIADGVRRIMVLGAGFDTLGLTLLHADAELLVAELDRPAMVEAKELALAAADVAPPWPRSVAVDLSDTRALTRALDAAGWRQSDPALCVAELALEYLEPGAAFAVLSTIGTLSHPRSRIACTVRFGDVDDDHLAAATAAVGEPMRFRPLSAELPALVARAGLDVLSWCGGRLLGRYGASAFLLLGPASTTQSTDTGA
jgi:methyltransferase (TIGR00027 family)